MAETLEAADSLPESEGLCGFVTIVLCVLARGEPLEFEPEAGSEPRVVENGDELLETCSVCVSTVGARFESILIDDC